MKIAHLSIHRVNGLIGLPDDADYELFSSHADQARAFLTVDREPYFLHLRRVSAYGRMAAQTLVNVGDSSRPAAERFERALASAAISEDLRSDRPLLIIETISTVETLTPGRMADMGMCCLGLRLFDSTAIVEVATDVVPVAIASIALMLPLGATPTVQAIGTVSYAIEPETGRYLYSLELSLSGTLTGMTSVDATHLTEGSKMAQSLMNNPSLQAVANLLARSLQTTDDLQAFLTAWAGFEIFLDKTFDAYKSQLYYQLKVGIASAARPFVDRLKTVIEKEARYNVRDKFVVVSSFLSMTDAQNDTSLFCSIKKTRDSIHVMRLPPHRYPTPTTQTLLCKYLRLYLLATT